MMISIKMTTVVISTEVRSLSYISSCFTNTTKEQYIYNAIAVVFRGTQHAMDKKANHKLYSLSRRRKQKELSKRNRALI